MNNNEFRLHAGQGWIANPGLYKSIKTKTIYILFDSTFPHAVQM